MPGAGPIPPAPLVARQADLAIIEDALAQAMHGQGLALVLSGEGGIGKSFLAQEALRRAQARGADTLQGQCHALNQDLSFAPLAEALGRYLRQLSGQERAQRLRGLDDLGRLLPGVGLTPPAPLGDASTDRTRLFAALAHLLQRSAEARPLVLLLDDLQWADRGTVQMLQFLVGELSQSRICWVLTYRPAEVPEDHPLVKLLRSLRRGGALVERALDVLSAAEVDELARATLGGKVAGDVSDFLYARTAGVPLLVDAVLRGLVEEAAIARVGGAWGFTREPPKAAPVVVRELLRERLAQLAPLERRLVEALSVAGTEVLLDDLSWLAPAEDLAEARAVLETHRLVTPKEAGLALANPILQEVAYAGLRASERRALHAAYIQALSQRGAPAALLGWHYMHAGEASDPARTLAALIEAARDAVSSCAYARAAALLGAAVEVAKRAGYGEQLGPLLGQQGAALEAMGALHESSRALEAALPLSAEPARSRLAGLLARVEWQQGNKARALSLLHEAEDALRALGASAARADILYESAQMRCWAGAREGAEDALSQLQGLARTLQTPRARAQAALAAIELRRADLSADELRADLEESLHLAESITDPALALHALDLLIVQAAHHGEYGRQRELLSRALQLAKRAGALPRELWPRYVLALLEWSCGAWVVGEEHALHTLSLARRLGLPPEIAIGLAIHAHILARRGDFDGAQEALAELRERIPEGVLADNRVAALWVMTEAVVAIEKGELEPIRGIVAAYAQTQRASHRTTPPSPDGIVGEALVLLGELEEAEHLLGRLARNKAPLPQAFARRIEAYLLRQRGDRENARAAFRDAAARFSVQERPLAEALCWAELSELAEGDERATAASRARTLFLALGATHRAARLAAPPSAPPKPSHDGLALSAREREIAQLVSEGLSSQEIGRRLFISPRTVTTHLNNVYQRLSIHSRAELTRYLLTTPAKPQ